MTIACPACGKKSEDVRECPRCGLRYRLETGDDVRICIRSSRALLDLLKLIAFQVGSEVSLNELATQVKLDVKTVGRHLDILEKAFVIVRLGGFSRNLRNEVTSKAKYYFLDNGIRNAIIGQYNLLDSRNDIGALWENFIVAERLKKRSYAGIYGNIYFWRTYDGQEVDYVEESDGGLFGFGKVSKRP
ncbi:MAG: DUF4143 domain-containing protein [Syntrophales bacterium]